MDHLDILKRAFNITWRYRSLWLFGFFLALCGGGGGGGGNFNFPGGGGSNDFGNFEDIPGLPSIDQNTIIAVIIGLVCLVIFLVIISVLVQVIARAALIGMVRQIIETKAVTIADGWHLGWSRGAWRVFLLGLAIGVPVAIISFVLILVALSPLLLLITGETALIVVGVVLTVLAVLFVILVLIIIGAIISPIQELAWRRSVLDDQGVIDALVSTFHLIRHNLKDVLIVWLLMFGLGLAWVFVALIVVLPVALIGAILVGGIPAGLVYIVSNSLMGAAIAGIPLALFVLIMVTSAGGGLYLIFQSTVWTLAYLDLQDSQVIKGPDEEDRNDSEAPLPALDPQPVT
jgi:hypothetical protein